MSFGGARFAGARASVILGRWLLLWRHTVRVDHPERRLTAAERIVLSLLLEPDFAGVAELRSQAATASVVGQCGCGCPSVQLRPGPDAPAAAISTRLSPVEAQVRPVADEPPGEVILFLDHGRLDYLEYVYYGTVPRSWPGRDRFSLRSTSAGSSPAAGDAAVQMAVVIRVARSEDLPVLREVERAAGEPFRTLGMAAVADDEPLTTAELAAFQTAGRAWVATDEADRPIAYLLVDVVDGNAHIEQVSVHPSHARQGLGRQLLATAAGWAAQHGLAALTLTTYANVPWNGPYYTRLGFQILTADQISPGLDRILERERAQGLARWPRITMRRKIDLHSLA